MAKPSPIITDCLIIGGGPAGLTAALYLARFRRKVILCDTGKSRAALIPQSFNYPGFNHGVSGPELLRNLRVQAEHFGALLQATAIESLQQIDGNFLARFGAHEFIARTVILATGIVDQKPALPDMKEFIYQGAIRFCPVCDGYEAIDKKIGVMGPFPQASAKALFLRTYSSDITLFTDEANLPSLEVEKLKSADIKIIQGHYKHLKLDEKVTLVLDDNRSYDFDVLYPAMGCTVRSELASQIGVLMDEEGYIITDSNQMTNVPGFFAVGDVVKDLSQISVGTGQAAIAAVAVHKSLEPVYRI